MFRALSMFVACGLWPIMAASIASAPCSIQRAAAAGSYVWLMCGQKDLLVSADEGKTWQVRRLPYEVGLRAITFLDSRRGFIVGDEGTLLATDDGAVSWRRLPLPTQETLTSIHFVGDLGWLAGWSGVILHSRDGGRSWERQPTGVLQGLDSIFFADADHGWAVGWVGTILRTTNGGQTWQSIRTSGMSWSLSSVCFRDANRGWAVGFNGQILRSDDGGLTWERQASPVRSWLTSVVFDASGRGWIAAHDKLLVSEDDGDTWRSVPVSADAPPFLHQVLPVRDSLWAVGQFGVLRKAGEERGFAPLATLAVVLRPSGTV